MVPYGGAEEYKLEVGPMIAESSRNSFKESETPHFLLLQGFVRSVRNYRKRKRGLVYLFVCEMESKRESRERKLRSRNHVR